MQKTPSYEENLGNWYSYFSHAMGAFPPSNSYPIVLFITLEMHGIFHKFSMAQQNTAKIIELSKDYGCFLPLAFILKYTLSHKKYMAFPITFL